MRALLMRGDLSTEDIETLVEFAKQQGGIEYSFDFMRRLQKQATHLLDRYPDSEWRQAFAQLFEYIIARDR